MLQEQRSSERVIATREQVWRYLWRKRGRRGPLTFERNDRPSISRTSRSASATSRRCATSASKSGAESSSPCSARAAAARRRRCGWSAGFEQPTAGRILIDGTNVAGLPPFKRPDQHGLPELRALPAPERGGERRLRAAPARASTRRGHAPRGATELERVGLRPRPSASRASSPAASSSASPSRAR